MKKLQGLSAAILIAGLCVGASLSASAAVDITLNKDTFGTIPYDTFFAQTANPSAGQIADAIGATVDQVWKADYPSLALGSGYTIVYDPTDGTGKATITWNGDWYVDTTKPTYLIVKDGAYSEVDGIAYGGSYLWKLQGKWDGQGTITILDMFPGNGSVDLPYRTGRHCRPRALDHDCRCPAASAVCGEHGACAAAETRAGVSDQR